MSSNRKRKVDFFFEADIVQFNRVTRIIFRIQISTNFFHKKDTFKYRAIKRKEIIGEIWCIFGQSVTEACTSASIDRSVDRTPFKFRSEQCSRALPRNDPLTRVLLHSLRSVSFGDAIVSIEIRLTKPGSVVGLQTP